LDGLPMSSATCAAGLTCEVDVTPAAVDRVAAIESCAMPR
jgi:hypothetical protein